MLIISFSLRLPASRRVCIHGDIDRHEKLFYLGSVAPPRFPRALSFRFRPAGEGACAVVVLPSFNHDKSKYDGEAAAAVAAVAEVCELVCHSSPKTGMVSWIVQVPSPSVCLTFFEGRTRKKP